MTSLSVCAPLNDRVRAQALMQRGQFAEAAQLLGPLTTANPKDADLQYRLGVAQQRAGNLTAAANAYTRAARLRPNEAVYAAALARLCAAMARYDRASFWYRKALRLRPKSIPLAQEAAALALQHDQPVEAEMILKQAAAQNPQSSELWLLLAQCYRAMKLGAEEARALERALHLKPLQPQQLRQLIDLYLRSGQPERALPYLQMGRRQWPHDVALRAQIAECYLAINDRPAAIATYREIVRLAPGLPQHRLALAELLAESDSSGALAEYEAAFRLQQPLGEQLVAVAALAARAGDQEAARRYLTWLVALQPHEVEPRQTLIESALAHDDFATAAVQWHELQLAGHQRYAVDEAELALRLGGREWALGRLQEVADRSAGDPALQAKLASLFRQLHDGPRAEILAEAALAGSADRPTRLLAARVLLQVERVDRAQPVFEEILRAEPQNAVAVRGLALCLLTAGQVRRAWERLRQAVHDNPRDLETVQAFIDAAEAADELDASAFLLRELLRDEPENAVLIEGLVLLYRRQDGASGTDAPTRMAELAEWEPRKGLITLTAARELAAAGRPREAAALYERLARSSDFTAAGRIGLCHVLLAQQRYAELLAALTRLTGPQAIGTEPYRLLLALRSDLVLRSETKVDMAAVAQAAAAVALADLQSEDYYLSLAELYLALGQVEQGVAFLQAEATRKEVAPGAVVGLARLLRKTNRGREALIWMEQAGRAAKSPAALLERAQCLLQVQRVAEAGMVAEQALRGERLGVRGPEAHLIAGEACALGYRPEEALWHYVQAMINGGQAAGTVDRIASLCSNQPLAETAVLNALRQLYARGHTDGALGIADALVDKPGFGKIKAWALHRARAAQSNSSD